MSKWLEKIIAPGTAVTRKSNLPARISPNRALAPLAALRDLELTKGLPPATIIYGGASGALFAIALYFLVTGHWLNGFLTMLPAACFLGFAIHLMKHGQ